MWTGEEEAGVRGEAGGQAPGNHAAALHRIWRAAGAHHGGHGEVSAPASHELRDTRRRRSLPNLSDQGALEVCSTQPAQPAVNFPPRSPKPPPPALWSVLYLSPGPSALTFTPTAPWPSDATSWSLTAS